MARSLLVMMINSSLCAVLLLAYLQESQADKDSFPNSRNGVLRNLLREPNSINNIDCASACNYRCSKASLHKRCIKYCNICCGNCKCVPSGTSGNKEECPCYNELKNSKGGPKCP
ncbi:hypothetical protein O6H91_02G094100 [Diphasiastrum complanatum]|uniref:Uncharacterized protein n=1 Tax=Diphasiastrum complanatum TaxID=34168 RepID=A0ACC2EIB9_DIPCM|nr:hypothetical protein O6H91_02G094100 [Diphasiastrum complanatum]